MIDRIQKRSIGEAKKSVLFLGPHQLGKSALVRGLNPDIEIDFSDQSTFLEFAADPSILPGLIERNDGKSVFIDEVQRLPSILNTIQSLLDHNKRLKFYLTGSSARHDLASYLPQLF